MPKIMALHHYPFELWILNKHIRKCLLFCYCKPKSRPLCLFLDPIVRLLIDCSKTPSMVKEVASAYNALYHHYNSTTHVKLELEWNTWNAISDLLNFVKQVPGYTNGLLTNNWIVLKNKNSRAKSLMKSEELQIPVGYDACVALRVEEKKSEHLSNWLLSHKTFGHKKEQPH